MVAPFAGAWIEIGASTRTTTTPMRSLPSRERGLKSDAGCRAVIQSGRSLRGSLDFNDEVQYIRFGTRESLPSRERGLKYVDTGKGFSYVRGRSLRGNVD